MHWGSSYPRQIGNQGRRRVCRLAEGRGSVRAAQAEDVVSIDSLTGLLAARVMGSGVRPDRFLIKGRQWMPRWRFQPADRLEDAFRLLDAADPSEYSIYRQGSLVSVRVLIAGRVGEARR